MDLVAIAPKGTERPLEEEVGARILERHDRLFILKGHECPVWAQNVWLEPKTFKFKSISEAVKHLRAIQRNWWPHSVTAHRRAALIQAELPPLRPKPLPFPAVLPKAPMGAFTLLDENTMIYSARCSSLFPDGEIEFVENKIDPPSRAYLKLWEHFTINDSRPKAGETVLDLGSSPGGWTWVLDQLGCNVISVDKAPLDKNVKLSTRVKFLNESAFGLKPENLGHVDWLFSDVICYPERLFELTERWRKAGTVKNFVCTLKFQGPTDFEAIRKFQAIEGSNLTHLHCNKHELTWSLHG